MSNSSAQMSDEDGLYYYLVADTLTVVLLPTFALDWKSASVLNWCCLCEQSRYREAPDLMFLDFPSAHPEFVLCRSIKGQEGFEKKIIWKFSIT
jgi:hypothetical protein